MSARQAHTNPGRAPALGSPQTPGCEPKSAPVFDSLVHATADGRWFGSRHDASLARLLAEMDAAGVSQAVLVALAGHIPNAFVMQAAAAHPARLIAGLSLDPSRCKTPQDAARLATQTFSDFPQAVLKLHPRLNHYDPLDERHLALLEALANLPQPPLIWLDTLFHSPRVILKKAPLEAIHELLVRFPALHFVLLHGAGPALLALSEIVREHENALIDLSLFLPRYAKSSLMLDLRELLWRFDRRLVFGSDFPEHTATEALAILLAIDSDLPAQKRNNILHDNLARLFAQRNTDGQAP